MTSDFWFLLFHTPGWRLAPVQMGIATSSDEVSILRAPLRLLISMTGAAGYIIRKSAEMATEQENNSERFLELLEESIRKGTFVKATLGKSRGDGPRSILLRLVSIKGTDNLSLLLRYATRAAVENHPVDEGLAIIREQLGSTFLSGHLFTLEHDVQVEFSRKRKAHLSVSRPTVTSLPSKNHDREKHRLIDTRGSFYLRALGVLNDEGEVRERMGDKFRQINRFVEILAGLFDASELASRREISIADMGSGKGYLTFAAYDYFANVRGISARVTGVEARPDLVELCNTIARDAGFTCLEFRTGMIDDYDPGHVDILIALHACNTATDDAIYRGIKAGAAIIICAPCCHKEIRPQIVPPPALRGILHHGILLEREAEHITDGLRALLLESSGYAARVFEFISTEHTQKNTMIVGVRGAKDTDREKALREIGEIKGFYGIREQRLEKLLREES